MAYSNQSGPVRVRHIAPSAAGERRAKVAAGTSHAQKSPAAERVVSVDGIEVHLFRKSVKNLNLRISRDGSHVSVSMPSWMAEREALDFVRRKATWIEAHLAQAADAPMARASRATPEEVAQWRAVVSACVPPLVEAWEPIMGVKHGSLVYRNMTSRWGSCQPSTGRICINVRLALYPPECLEYVVVHELCHLLERGHGPRFRQLMDTFLPDWKQRRAKLR